MIYFLSSMVFFTNQSYRTIIEYFINILKNTNEVTGITNDISYK